MAIMTNGADIPSLMLNVYLARYESVRGFGHSLSSMVKSVAMKDMGRKMMVIMVNTRMACPCFDVVTADCGRTWP